MDNISNNVRVIDLFINYNQNNQKDNCVDEKAKIIWKNLREIYEKYYSYRTENPKYPKNVLKVIKYWLTLTLGP
jgi:hypothetical protein